MLTRFNFSSFCKLLFLSVWHFSPKSSFILFSQYWEAVFWFYNELCSAKVLEVDITEFFKDPNKPEEELNISILEKVKLIDTLEEDEKNCLLKMIDIAIAKKRMKDNLSTLISQ